MAGGSSKKRRRSKSPARSGPTKCARQVSRTSSVQTENVASSRDRHLIPTPTRNSTPLPTNDDWVFRVKVISSTKDLDNEVFRKAVQGLVKICFPSGVLEELGIDVLKQHMQEENAPAENIAKMTEVFRSEMIQRVACMLAAYLDTPAKVGAGVRSVIEASAEMHSQLGDDLRNVVKASLDAQQSIADNEVEDDADHFSDVEPSPPPIKKHKHRPAAKERSKPRDEEGSDMDIDPPAQVPESSQAAWSRVVNKDNKKISTSWRWDIDLDTFSMDAVPEVFKRTSDLFAYHALPIARGMLNTNATRKEVRLQMQTMLAEMPENDFRKWAESLQKLYEGDEIMLVRIEPEAVSDKRKRSTATPAPIDMRRRITAAATKTPGHATQGGAQPEAVRKTARDETRIKKEFHADSHLTTETRKESQAPEKDGVATTTAAFRHLSTEERELGSSRAGNRGSEGSQGLPMYHQGNSRPSDTPIIDLLWGTNLLELKTRSHVVETIMKKLYERVTAHCIGVQLLNGSTMVMTKGLLKSKLLGRDVRSVTQNTPTKVRDLMEQKLIPWVISHPSTFPELLSEPFMFVNIIPQATCVLDLLCHPQTSIAKSNSAAVKDEIFIALRTRAIDKLLRFGPCGNTLYAQVNSILADRTHPDIVKRGFLEKVLRQVALAYRGNFPELKTSLLVRTWERETGQNW